MKLIPPSLLAILARLALAACLAGLAACASLLPGPKSIHLSEARLQQLIGSQFPFNNRLLDILEVQVSAPRLRLDSTSNRIHTALDLGLASRGLGALLTRRDLQGSIDLSYGLRFEPSDQSVRLSDVRVASLQLPGAPAQFQGSVNKLGAALAEQVLRDYPIYRFSAEDLKAAAGWGYRPGAFSIGGSGISLALEPVARP